MRIGLTTGPLPHHKFFIQRFYDEFKDQLIFSITQKNNNKNQKRKTTSLAKKAVQHLSGWNATQSYILSKIYKRKSRQLLSKINFPDELNHIVDDINSDRAEKIVKDCNVDILVVFGGKIIKSNILRLPKRESYTIHLGWCPDYKGSHGLHWAIYDENIDKIGFSILTLSENVDSGEIVQRNKINLSHVKDEYDLTFYAQMLAIEEMIKIVKIIIETKELPETMVQEDAGKVYFSKEFTAKVKGQVRENMVKYKLL